MFKPLSAAFIGGSLCAMSAFAQTSAPSDSQSKTVSASPVAYVYVTSTDRSGKPNVIIGYSAASNGALAVIPGSPFNDNVSSMAVNGKYLMGFNYSTDDIDALKIGADGALTYSTSTPCLQPGDSCFFSFNIFFDHTGADLYAMEFDGSNDLTASFSVDKSNGALNYLGDSVTGALPGDYLPTFFIGNNEYAFSADQSSCLYPGVYGFQRESNGLLNSIATTYNQPIPPVGVSIYYPVQLVADPTNNLAFLEQPANPPGCAPGPLQIAVYTADANGNLTTSSTYQNMPATAIKSPSDMKMSPSGKLLAVAGREGLQVFHFNGSSPVTHYTGLLTNDPIGQMFWDNSDHLYAISAKGKLYVGTITPTSLSSAPGSPYRVPNPQSIIVQPLN